jgi:hypothetical protein
MRQLYPLRGVHVYLHEKRLYYLMRHIVIFMDHLVRLGQRISDYCYAMGM